QLRAVDMLTATFGYGVATTNDVAQNRSYLVVTRDAARHWHLVARMPVTVVTPANSLEVNPTLVQFASTLIGYVSTATGVEVTRDGGRTWKRVDLGAPVLDWRLGTSGLVAVTRACAQYCPLRIVTASLGSTTVRTSAVTPRSRVPDQRVAAMSVVGRDAWILTTSPADAGGDPHLWDVSSRGVTALSDPCRGLKENGYVTTQMLVDNSGTYLYCFADVGMNQGYNELWYRAGLSGPWTLRLTGSPFRSAGRDSLGDSQYLLGLASSGARLVAVSVGAYTGIATSSDGGRTWTHISSTALAQVAGAPSSLAPWGDGSMLVSSDGALFALSNGRVVSMPLPAGVDSQIPWCSPQVTSVGLGPSSGPFGDYVATAQVQGNLDSGTCAFRGTAYLELFASPDARGVARRLAPPSRLTPWPNRILLSPARVLDFTVHFEMGGTSCAPTFVSQVVLDVGPERFLVWSSQSPPLGICVRHPAVVVGRPYTYHPV
ncbi:MAG TPA: hypothetical protein VFN54_06205, partial [Acidimicrobiales bacterium]|nr:hypothetical protein [Acidimicrobiales bacterium]